VIPSTAPGRTFPRKATGKAPDTTREEKKEAGKTAYVSKKVTNRSRTDSPINSADEKRKDQNSGSRGEQEKRRKKEKRKKSAKKLTNLILL
jgi:hypothetical protein